MTDHPPFHDRAEGGRALARVLLPRFVNRDDVVVLALPRGGVPVAFEVAKALGVPLDVMLVRKLGVPGQPELAMGAISTWGTRILNGDVVEGLAISDAVIEEVTESERRELERRSLAFRGDRPEPEVAGKSVILVDDGFATGSTMRAAIKALRRQKPGTIIAAAPIGSRATCAELAQEVDDAICVEVPEPFHAVGQGYEDFTQTTDDEVRELLDHAASERGVVGRRT